MRVPPASLAPRELSGGASQETWSFDIVHPNGIIGAILRRAPQGFGASPRGRRAGCRGHPDAART